jgi:hypothetical protein
VPLRCCVVLAISIGAQTAPLLIEVERRCQPYDSTGIVRVQGATVEAAKTAVKNDEQKPPIEVKAVNDCQDGRCKESCMTSPDDVPDRLYKYIELH